MVDAKKVVEYVFFVVVGIITLLLGAISFYSYVFIPASLIMCSLLFFGCSYILDVRKKKKVLMILSFLAGILLLFSAIFYTLVNTR